MRLTVRPAPTRQWAFLTRLPPIWSAVVIVAALLVVFELDRSTASAPVQHLYYMPIIFAGVMFRMRGSLLAAFGAIALYHLANPSLLNFRYEESDLVQICLFIGVGLT